MGNERIISGSGDKTIKIWNRVSGECERTLSGHSNSVVSVCVMGNERIISGSSDKTIKIWNKNN